MQKVRGSRVFELTEEYGGRAYDFAQDKLDEAFPDLRDGIDRRVQKIKRAPSQIGKDTSRGKRMFQDAVRKQIDQAKETAVAQKEKIPDNVRFTKAIRDTMKRINDRKIQEYHDELAIMVDELLQLVGPTVTKFNILFDPLRLEDKMRMSVYFVAGVEEAKLEMDANFGSNPYFMRRYAQATQYPDVGIETVITIKSKAEFDTMREIDERFAFRKGVTARLSRIYSGLEKTMEGGQADAFHEAINSSRILQKLGKKIQGKISRKEEARAKKMKDLGIPLLNHRKHIVIVQNPRRLQTVFFFR